MRGVKVFLNVIGIVMLLLGALVFVIKATRFTRRVARKSSRKSTIRRRKVTKRISSKTKGSKCKRQDIDPKVKRRLKVLFERCEKEEILMKNKMIVFDPTKAIIKEVSLEQMKRQFEFKNILNRLKTVETMHSIRTEYDKNNMLDLNLHRTMSNSIPERDYRFKSLLLKFK